MDTFNIEFIQTNKNCKDPNKWIYYITVYQCLATKHLNMFSVTNKVTQKWN